MMGVDIGTTSTKAVLFDENGTVISKCNTGYPLYTEAPGEAEQDPEEIFQAAVRSIREAVKDAGVSKEEIRFVSFSSAMHSLIVMDSSNKPITRSITWADQRSEAWTKKLKKEWNGHEIYLRTGTPIHPMSPLSKIIWLREDKPELFMRASKFISIKEYVFFRLFGKYIIDHSIASATGLFNLANRNWDTEALEIAGISSDQLPELVPTTFQLKGLNPEFASELGLQADTPFIAGASDGVLSNLGVNAIDPGVAALTIGTSGAIRAVTDRPVTDPKGRIFCYALTEEHWVIGGAVNNGGMIFQWLKDELCQSEAEAAEKLGQDPYTYLTGIAAKVRPGSEGLIFHPYLAGERAPIWNAHARGAFFGLGLHHKKDHMIRAVLEGINYNLYTVLLALKELIGIPKKVHATGGFAQSEFWRQLLTDILNQEVLIPESYESSCLGAVILGMYALGEIDSLSEAKRFVSSNIRLLPDKESAQVYQELIPIYIRLARMYETEFEEIAAFQTKYGKEELPESAK
ncbi:gluconokinase [Bacillus sp. FJAT-42376]|uniref:gluconokinase n=1 Tax=Bacillus sp. FJAT-42376 TaxID=2014076 RepID=UPI000F4DD5E2|nr:gluconokinase [Bacillus sp. FJAT-42376]AZB44820.1 gluconokinase [Bacillus sp. FJAT-42376]